ncbi:MAG: hypothetical protein B7Z02_12365 [Rhodobacterales bacterium 32-67-9]|nr:MAG: hypothetical protein B7Z02_12365 [Rhodobacterales bacterium 32-67-9]
MPLARTLALTGLIALPLPALAEMPLTVEIVTAHAEAQSQSYSLTGDIRAHETLSAAFPMGGRIIEVLVDAGMRVEKGSVLARMDSVQQEQSLRAAEAGMLTATADYRQAAEDLDRQDTLLERGATTRIARDSAEDALRIAEGVLAQARAELDQATKAVADTVLLAPESATVTRRMAEAGQIVGAAQPVIELALGTEVDAVFDVPEVMLSIGEAPPVVTLNLLDTPDDTFTGRIDEISPVVDATTGTVTVKVSIDAPPAGLTFGDAVRGTVVRTGPAQVILPYSAISATVDGPSVWRVDPDTMKVAAQPIVIDRYETGRIVVASGIEDGMLIVGKGAQLLFPGRSVQAAEGTQ